jgi:hypothetical protein
MRRAANFNPEWGYLAPAPSFMRSARLVIVAAVIGASAGAAVVFSLADRPVAEQSVAARTLVQTPVTSESLVVSAPVVAQPQTESQHAQPEADAPPGALHRQAAVLAPANAGAAGLAAGESGTTSTRQHPASAVALAEAPAVTDAPPLQAVNEAAAAAPEPAPKAPNKKPRVAWRPAPRYDAQRYYMYAPRYYGAPQGFDPRYMQMERNSYGW